MDSEESYESSENSTESDTTKSESSISTPKIILGREKSIIQGDLCSKESDWSKDTTNDGSVTCSPYDDSTGDASSSSGGDGHIEATFRHDPCSTLNIEDNFNYSIERYLNSNENGADGTVSISVHDQQASEKSCESNDNNDNIVNRKRPRSRSSSDEGSEIASNSHRSSSTYESENSNSSPDTTSCDSSDTEASNEETDDQLLHEGATISQNNFKGSFLALSQRHNLPSKAVDSILKLIKMSLPEGNKCPTSSYMFDKSLADIGYSYVKYITCWKCQNLLENELCVQADCSKSGSNGNGQDSSTFYVIKLLPELKSLIMGKSMNLLIF